MVIWRMASWKDRPKTCTWKSMAKTRKIRVALFSREKVMQKLLSDGKATQNAPGPVPVQFRGRVNEAATASVGGQAAQVLPDPGSDSFGVN